MGRYDWPILCTAVLLSLLWCLQHEACCPCLPRAHAGKAELARIRMLCWAHVSAGSWALRTCWRLGSIISCMPHSSLVSPAGCQAPGHTMHQLPRLKLRLLQLRMSQDIPGEGHFISGLASFMTRTCYANSSGGLPLTARPNSANDSGWVLGMMDPLCFAGPHTWSVPGLRLEAP